MIKMKNDIMKNKNNVLKLDLDGYKIREAERMIKFRLKWINYYFKIFPAIVKYYKTHKGLHVYIITSREMTPYEIIIFQSCLNSDWLREIRNYKRVYDGMLSNWNLMFNFKFTFDNKKHIKYLSKEKFIKSYMIK